MTTKDLLGAIGAVDDETLLHAQKKRISPMVWVACGILAVLLVASILLSRRPTPFSHNIFEEKASWNMDAQVTAVAEQYGCENTAVIDCEYSFLRGFAVHARVLEVLPDIYVIPEKNLGRHNYRVLRLQVLDTVAGEELPEEIYFLLPEAYNPRLLQYDLLLNLDQVGVENYLLFNTTQRQAETFSLVFACGVDSREYSKTVTVDPTAIYTNEVLCILPYKDGVLTWPTGDAWAADRDCFEYFSTKDNAVYPLRGHMTLEAAKAAVMPARQAFADKHDVEIPKPKVLYADSYNMGINLGNFNTPEVGTFSQIYHQHEDKFLFCRVIDGFYTNEVYTFYPDGQMASSEVEFTQEEIEHLPKLYPTVTQVLNRAPVSGTCRLFTAYYYKTDWGIYGVVRAKWEVNWETDVSIIILVNPDGTTEEVSLLELVARLDDGITPTEKLDTQQGILSSLEKKSYQAECIYDNRKNVNITAHINQITNVYIAQDGNVICFGYNESYLADARSVSPDSVELPPQVGTARYVWKLHTSADSRWLRYLVRLENGMLLLVTGYDYTGLENTSRGKTLFYIYTLHVDGSAQHFFQEWEEAALKTKDTHPNNYNLWKKLQDRFL